MKLISHKDSPRANPSRGYHDMEVIIQFEGETESEREGAKKALLAFFDKDMWKHVTVFNEKELRISHGYDSGD